MKNLSSWLIAIFAFAFWLYRVVATALYSMGTELVLPPMDMIMEILLLFITFNITYILLWNIYVSKCRNYDK